MLYSDKEMSWKLVDFGFSTEGVSQIASPSLSGRGTPCYRAPELTTDRPEFTNKVDIWALGCIFYELCAKRKAFSSDWEVRTLWITPGQGLQLSRGLLPEDYPPSLYECIERLLVVNPRKRPSAATALSDFLKLRNASDPLSSPHRLGLQVFRTENKLSTKMSKRVDLIFVHGFGETSRGGWTNAATGDFWPFRLSLCSGLQQCRIVTFGYESDSPHTWREDGSLDLNHLSNQLLSALTEYVRADGDVVHS